LQFNLAFVFIDIHTHQIINGAKNSKFIYNVIVGKDLEPQKHWFSIGIHPWYIRNEAEQLNALKDALLDNNQKLLFVGECGLDKIIETPLEKQIEVFEQQIKLSEQFKKPLIIHCVRAYQEILKIKNQSKPKQSWIIHGFNRKYSIAEKLIAEQVSLSFGYSYLNTETGKLVLRKVPLNKIFLETDADTTHTIEEVYILAASILAIPVKELENQIKENLCRITGWREQRF